MLFLLWVLFLLWILASAVLIFVVLIQSGKGGGLSSLVSAGTTLGDTLGASGVEKTLNRWTTYCAIGFLVITILIVILGPHALQKDILSKVPTTASAPAPTEGGAAPATGAPVTGPTAPAAVPGSTPAAPEAAPEASAPAPAEGAGAPAPAAAAAPADAPAAPADAPAAGN